MDGSNAAIGKSSAVVAICKLKAVVNKLRVAADGQVLHPLLASKAALCLTHAVKHNWRAVVVTVGTLSAAGYESKEIKKNRQKGFRKVV